MPGRFEFVEVAETDEETMDDLRDAFTSLERLIVESTTTGRYQDLALKALEEASMWANKSLSHK